MKPLPFNTFGWNKKDKQKLNDFVTKEIDLSILADMKEFYETGKIVKRRAEPIIFKKN
jgi:hypothetical protein